jgi:hypothetical protein
MLFILRFAAVCFLQVCSATKQAKEVSLSDRVFTIKRLSTMVLGIINNFKVALRYRGGWKGLLEHMYTVSYASRFECPSKGGVSASFL